MLYSKKFFKNQKDGSLKSAREIVPLILDLFPIKSVLDVGCGVGTWLYVFQEQGIKNIKGMDGDYVDKEALLISHDNFISCDLDKKIRGKDFYDLVVSLEVAEHISKNKADNFIDFLISQGNVVLFSAAIPGQGGVGHLNEQWPEYWIGKFKDRNYICVDCLREKIWNNKRVKWWYAQNIFIFVKKDKIDKYPKIKEEELTMTSVVHPEKYIQAINSFSLKNLFRRIIFRKYE